MSPTALEIQDICDYICDILRDSIPNLRTCSLISPVFTPSAQRHIFREIDFLYPNDAFETPAIAVMIQMARRLGSILAQSPYLIRFIRSLSVVLDQQVLAHLIDIQFTHLDSLTLEGPNGGKSPLLEELTTLGAHWVAYPTLRELNLMSIIFADMRSLSALFSGCTSPFELVTLDDVMVVGFSSLPIIAPPESGILKPIWTKALSITYYSLDEREVGWLIDPLCPLDVSTLQEMHIWTEATTTIVNLMRSVRLSLHTLRIDAMSVTRSFRLADFPGLTTIEVAGGLGGSDAISTLLASIGTTVTRLQNVTVRISVLGTPNDNSLRRLDSVVADLDAPALAAVHVRISRARVLSVYTEENFIERMQGLRALFPKLSPRGYLRLTYISDGIEGEL
ncbi:hypothetical protein B0H16DRAFT_1523227 [Mycena metata]|uniref:Uncharacterized protein n=1 Tax=Mycena metata TaxID=1033252 RepID=A0AAD7JJH0_9AGAR|nr:hypothetical protein B0H16DRAFT_1523227 [Mycena metata]